MTMLVILATVIGALVVAAIAYTRKNTEPIQLGVGRKLRRRTSRTKGEDSELCLRLSF